MKIFLWIVGAAAVLYLVICLVIFLLACRRFPPNRHPLQSLTHATDSLLEPYQDVLRAGERWLDSHPYESVALTAYDGTALRGRLYETPGARALLIACHGYRSDSRRDFAAACPYYAGQGLSILLIDQRATGQSEGKYITFGVRESRDVRDWCGLMEKRFPGLPIVAAGLSMGAAAVLMAADEMPPAVKALAADCGFVSPWEEFSHVARHYIGRPAVILLPGVGLWCRLLGGFGLRERSAAESLRKCALPVFFIHGEADGFVPHGHSEKNRAACAGPTVFFSVPGAEHGMSYLADPDGYHAAAGDFFRKYVFAESAPSQNQL